MEGAAAGAGEANPNPLLTKYKIAPDADTPSAASDGFSMWNSSSNGYYSSFALCLLFVFQSAAISTFANANFGGWRTHLPKLTNGNLIVHAPVFGCDLLHGRRCLI